MEPTFHRIWFGNKPLPSHYEDYWAAWQRQFPACTFRTWTDADIDELERTRDKLKSLSNVVSRADIARYEILSKHGGIYLDCDILPYNHFDAADLCRELTVCNEDESTQYCSIGFIGAPAGHPIFDALIDHLLKSPIDESQPNHSTGPWLFGRFLQRHQFRRLPTAAFYPYLYNEPLSVIRRRNLDQTFGIHVWGGAWLAPEQQMQKAAQFLDRGDIAEAARILAGSNDPWALEIGWLVHHIRSVRTSSAEIADRLNTPIAIDNADQPVFEFSKVVHWLLEANPDRMVWQIGAADGVLVDPLRSAMVNFDPPSVLLEPNPYLFAMLRAGYANNRNALPLQLAYSKDRGELVLNAINPAKVAELGLPHWVLGISSMFDDKHAIGGLTIDPETTRKIQLCIERVAVPVVDFAGLVQHSGGRGPDILVVDAEGMDKTIIDDILDRGGQPAVIHFEIQCMDAGEVQALATRLSQNYALFQFGNDVTAYSHAMLKAYTQSIYIKNGIPTVYSNVLRSLNGLI